MSYIIKDKTYDDEYKHFINKEIKEIKGYYNLDLTHRYCLRIYYNNNSQKNIFIIMQNPSTDKCKNGTLTKIINKFNQSNIHSIIIINLFSIIENKINKNNYNILLCDEYCDNNINVIKEIIIETKANHYIFGCGQHTIKHISKCKNKYIDQYNKIIEIIQTNILPNEIKISYFDKMVMNNMLPGYPKGLLNILDLDIDILINNLKLI
jgi:hypothetical protein